MMFRELSLAITPVIALGFASAALAQQSQHDLSAGSGDHMRSYGAAQNPAPQATTPQPRTTQPRAASRRATPNAPQASTRQANTRQPNTGQAPDQTREVSARSSPTQAPQVPRDPTPDHMIYYGPVR